MNDGVSLRRLEPLDLPEVSSIHTVAFPSGVLTKLGSCVIQKYYEWQMLGPHEVYTCGAFLDGKCVGFYVGGSFRGATSGFLRHNQWFLVKHLLSRPWLIANPMVRARIKFSKHVLERSLKLNSPESMVKRAKKDFAILAIAVDPTSQRLGIGKMLMREAERTAVANGFSAMCLFVKPDNTRAVEFYESLNWSRVSKNATWLGNMRKPLAA
jgi:ribosomal protein S18 acetylase RimI-like enzyme